MRIGIVTQPIGKNYGGIIQNYALQQALRKIGHEPLTLNQSISAPMSFGRIVTSSIEGIAKNMVRPFLGRPFIKLPYWLKKDIDYIPTASQAFMNRHIALTPTVVGKEAMRKAAKDNNLQAFVVGSDQVWRNGLFCIEQNFLDFTDGMDVKRVAYAASFGVDDWRFDTNKTKTLASLASRFDAISVREKSGIALCKEHLGVEAVHVLDPTMLLTKEEYLSLIQQDDCEPCKGNLFVYILDHCPAKTAFIDNIAKRRGLTPFEVRMNNFDRSEMDTPSQWLKSIAEADFVVCDSFHGTVFSIIFNKDFVVISNKGRGNTRFESLLSMFGLSDRLVYEDQLGDYIPQPIDWQSVNRIMATEREKGYTFLKTSLQ